MLAADAGWCDEIDARGLDGGVAKHICQPRDVVAFIIKDGGKKVPQVVRKDFAGRHMAGDGKAFHIGPHLITAHGFSIRGEKNLAADDFFLTGVLPQLVAEPGGNEDGADLSFEMDISAAARDGFGGDGGKLADADACGADGLNDEGDAPPATRTRGAQELLIFPVAEGAVVVAEKLALHAQIAHAAVVPFAIAKITVERGEHAVDGGWQIAALEEMVFPAADADFVDGFAIEPGGKGAKMAQVVGNGAGAALFALQIIDVVLKIVRHGILCVHNDSSNDYVHVCFYYCSVILGRLHLKMWSAILKAERQQRRSSFCSGFFHREDDTMHIITISREFGSGGRELGKRLAEALGYAYYDREILTMLAERTDLDEAYLAHTLEESAPSALFPITIGQTFSVLPNYQAEYSTQLLQKQTALIKELATKSDCVIVGRNADIILREQDPLRLFVHADMEARIARCRRREVSGEDFTDKEYEKKIRQVDKNRAKTHGILATYDWGDRRDYDLCINTTHVTVRDIIPALAAYARTWADHHA